MRPGCGRRAGRSQPASHPSGRCTGSAGRTCHVALCATCALCAAACLATDIRRADEESVWAAATASCAVAEAVAAPAGAACADKLTAPRPSRTAWARRRLAAGADVGCVRVYLGGPKGSFPGWARSRGGLDAVLFRSPGCEQPSERLTGREHKRMDSNPSKVGKHIHLAPLCGPPVGGGCRRRRSELRCGGAARSAAVRRFAREPAVDLRACPLPARYRPAVIGRCPDAQKGTVGPLAEFVSVVFLCGHDSDQGHERTSSAAAPCTRRCPLFPGGAGPRNRSRHACPNRPSEFKLGAGQTG